MGVAAPVRVIGVGSPTGDDQVGWCVVDALQASPMLRGLVPDKVTCLCLDRPGTGLLRHIVGGRTVFIVDALQSGAAPGTIRRHPAAGFTIQPALSGHGLGVAYTLELARMLGVLTEHVWLYSVELAHLDPDRPLNTAVHAAIPKLVSRLLVDLDVVAGVKVQKVSI
jgi:hydrogenase maturation protease